MHITRLLHNPGHTHQEILHYTNINKRYNSYRSVALKQIKPMARFILLLAAFAVVVAVADAKETVLLKRYTGGKGCKTLDKITDRWDGKTCAKIKTNYYKIIGKVDKCEDGANYTTRFYNNSGQ